MPQSLVYGTHHPHNVFGILVSKFHIQLFKMLCLYLFIWKIQSCTPGVLIMLAMKLHFQSYYMTCSQQGKCFFCAMFQLNSHMANVPLPGLKEKGVNKNRQVFVGDMQGRGTPTTIMYTAQHILFRSSMKSVTALRTNATGAKKVFVQMYSTVQKSPAHEKCCKNIYPPKWVTAPWWVTKVLQVDPERSLTSFSFSVVNLYTNKTINIHLKTIPIMDYSSFILLIHPMQNPRPFIMFV